MILYFSIGQTLTVPAVWLEGIKARESKNQWQLESHLSHIWLNNSSQYKK